jgi:5-formyltetrahydrofolate cyclo-ligase
MVLASLVEEKRALRLAMSGRRRSLGGEERARRSAALATRLLALPELGRAAVVAGFSALPTEIDPAAALGRRGLTVALPRVTDGAPRLRFHPASDPLVRGAHGILEPRADAPEIPPATIDLFLVPGLAFDPAGRRVGFGGGYYDELIAAVRATARPLFVGVGFDFQVVDRCPAGDTDALLDLVVTDARTLRPGDQA